MPNKNKNFRNAHHIPVLLEEVIECLNPNIGESYLDLTAGMGGHAAVILGATKAPQKATLVDRDPHAFEILTSKFVKSTVINQDFLSVSRDLNKSSRQYDVILADLGVSSLHFDDGDRGFSFQKEGPLDMRMDSAGGLTAEDIVNSWSEEDLARLIKEFGEEPRGWAIARAIVSDRPLRTTVQLAATISGIWPGKYHRIHPATKTFQALRIAVNDELSQLEQALPLWIELLAPQGRLAVISFHSLEDRIVKKIFAEHSKHPYEADLALINKRPITASPAEIDINPRARSAKLRAVAKIKTKERIK